MSKARKKNLFSHTELIFLNDITTFRKRYVYVVTSVLYLIVYIKTFFDGNIQRRESDEQHEVFRTGYVRDYNKSPTTRWHTSGTRLRNAVQSFLECRLSRG
jgi:hypothetical protein